MNFLRPSLCESIGDDAGVAEQFTFAVDDVEDFDLDGDKYLQAEADGRESWKRKYCHWHK